MHDFSFVIEKHGWIFPVGLVIFLLLIPFATAGLPGDSIFNIEVTHQQMKFRLIHEQALPAVMVAAVCMGLLAGLSIFRFVQDKKETTIFFSLGITRTRLFVNRLLTGILILAGSIGIPMGLSIWLNIKALGNYEGLFQNGIYLTIGLFTVSLISFLAASAVSFVAGTLSETIVYWIGGMSSVTIICFGSNLLMKKLYWGNAWGVVNYSGVSQVLPNLLERFAFLNPLLFFMNEMEKHAQFIRPLSTAVPEAVSYKLLTGWVILSLIMIWLCWYLLQKRKAEMAGISGSHRGLSELVIALSCFLVFAVVFSFLYDFSLLLAVVLGAASFFAVHLFWRKILFSYGTSWKISLASAIFQAAVVCLVCVVFDTGFFHRAERVLAEENITEAEITFVGAPSFLSEEAVGSSTGRGYYFTSQYTLNEPDAIEMVKELQQLFLQNGRMPLQSGQTIADTVIPYDICFTYWNEEGDEYVWYYDRASYEQLEAMLAIENLPSVKEGQTDLFTEKSSDGKMIWAQKAYAQGTIYLTDTFYSETHELSVTEEQRSELLSAVAEDLSEMTLEEKYFPEEASEAVLMFTQNGEQDCRYYSYHLDNAFLYLTPSYVHTLGWLEENQLLSLVQNEPEVEYILLQKMDPYIGINGLKYPMGMYFMAYCADTEDEFLIQKDFGKKYTITEEEEIRELLPGLQNGTYMTHGGFLAAVKLAGDTRFRYLFLPAEAVPSFIRG